MKYRMPAFILVFMWLMSCNMSFAATENNSPRVHEIYNQLIKAIGPAKDQPQLKVIRVYKKGDRLIYYRRFPQATIFVSQKLLDFCIEQDQKSDDLLAGLLAHELGHHHLNHQGGGFSSIFEKSGSEGSNAYGTSEEWEKAADAFGLIYSYLAGFNTLEAYPGFVKLIYENFYPDEYDAVKAKRSSSLRQHIEDLSSLLNIYESGIALLAAGKYDPAIQCFSHLVRQFPAKEVYNNIAVCYINKALHHNRNGESTLFAYPVEIDISLRLTYGTRDFTQEAQSEKWLDSAEMCLNKALVLDDAYTSGYVNLAVTKILLKNYDGALGLFNDYKRKYPEKLSGDFYLLKGIALTRKGEMKNAEAAFQQAVANNGFCAEYNYETFKRLRMGELHSSPDGVMDWMFSYFKGENTLNNATLLLRYVVDHPCANKRMPMSEEVNVGSSSHPLVIRYYSSDDCERIEIRQKNAQYKLEKISYDIPLMINDYEIVPDRSITSDSGRVYEYLKAYGLVIESKSGLVYAITLVD